MTTHGASEPVPAIRRAAPGRAAQIRPEAPQDYAAIASIHARAFGNRPVEAAVVALRRQSPLFDPELSLVAVSRGVVAGHVLLMPVTVRILGQNVPAVNLAPIAVEPECQRQGIGSALIAEAHAAAIRKKYTLSILLGDPAYYVRFGYRPGAFGSSFAEVASVPPAYSGLHRRSVEGHDIAALNALWRTEEQAVDFAMEPGEHQLEWLSPNPAIQASVYTFTGEVVGYTRVHSGEKHSPRVFLARDDRAAVSMAHTLAQDAGGVRLMLPLHPYSRSAHVFPAHCAAWEAGMACSLAENPFDEYYARVQAGRRVPGRPIWPVCFDLA